MDINDLKNNFLLVEDCVPNKDLLFEDLKSEVNWRNDIKSRKTASFGQPYNYSGIDYPYLPIPDVFLSLRDFVADNAGFEPNNVLLNYYENGLSKMGYHSDQTDILAAGTGIAIFSLGSVRKIKFKSIADPDIHKEICLNPGSFFYMTQEVQNYWKHAILVDKENVSGERISMPLRKMI